MPETPTQLAKQVSAVAALTDEVQAIKRELREVRTTVDETKDLVQLWDAAKVAGRVVKWLAGFMSGLAGLWLLVKAAGINLFK